MKFSSLKDTLFITLLIVVTVAFGWIVRPYFGSIFWAAILAIIFYPIQRMWLRWFRQRATLSAVVTLISIFAIVLVPLYFLGNALVRESIAVYQGLSNNESAIRQSLGETDLYGTVIEMLGRFGVDEGEFKTKLNQSVRSVAEYFFSRAASAGQNTLSFLAQFFIMFYLLFFFLRDGTRLLEKLSHLLPLGDQKERKLFDRFVSTARATLKGTLIIGLAQGLIGGLVFWLVGISAPVLWGVLMAVLSVIPAVGSVLVWAPAGALLLFMGNVWQGIVVLAVGVFVISLVDNVLRPPLVGRDTEMPDALVLLSTLGGISVFGITGFVIGPIVAAFFLSMWDMFEEAYHRELTERG